MTNRKPVTTISMKTITLIGMLTALTCVLAPLALPVGPVPVTFTNLVIYFGLYLLGTKKETVSCLLYLLIGFVGIPVFSGFTGGPQKLFGPTGGYLVGFLPMALIAGVMIEKCSYRRMGSIIGMLSGTGVCYIVGTVWLSYESKLPFTAAVMTGVVPFVPGDLLKILLAAWLAPKIRETLVRANLI